MTTDPAAIARALASARAPSRSRVASLGLTALLLALSASASSGEVPALDHLAGRWSGWGAVTHASGQAEQVKCVATYFVKDAGGAVEQNLRCASASYRIDASARLSISGGVVRGEWEERSNAAAGNVSGHVTGSGFNLSIQGEHFAAVMIVATSACKQSINITPQGVDIQRVAIGLEKC